MDLGVNNSDSFFSVSLDGKPMEGWCIEWSEDASFGINEGTNLYSTKGQEAWKELNYFMAIKDDLRAQDPELTYKEIQVVIWSLINNPSFDVDKISAYENISERIYKEGEPQFNVQKVKDIVTQVENHFTSAKSKINDNDGEYPGATFIKNDGQTIMVDNETAFAVKTKMVDGNKILDSEYSTCFDKEIIEDVSFPRWGWTNGPISPGTSLTLDIYAGAGQCDLEKGTLVGELTVEYSGGTLKVNYEMTETSGFTDALYTIYETHLYVGSEPYPTKAKKYTVAPGQYGNQHDLNDATEDSYTITGLNGDIYFIAHAVVSGFDPDATGSEQD